MTFDPESQSCFESDDFGNDFVDILPLLPVESEDYEEEQVLVVNGVPIDGSGAYCEEEEEEEWEDGGFVPFDQLIPAAEEPPAQFEWEEDEKEELETLRQLKQEQINDAYALAATAWTDDEAEDILRANLPSGGGLLGGGLL